MNKALGSALELRRKSQPGDKTKLQEHLPSMHIAKQNRTNAGLILNMEKVCI